MRPDAKETIKKKKGMQTPLGQHHTGADEQSVQVT